MILCVDVDVPLTGRKLLRLLGGERGLALYRRLDRAALGAEPDHRRSVLARRRRELARELSTECTHEVPVAVDADQHRIHREWYEIPAETRHAVEEAPRVVAVGTTVVRVLETAARSGAAAGWSDLYIPPPHDFRTVSALITNFHLPRSSLLLLVTAFVQAGMPGADIFAARDRLVETYTAAILEGYRFFSFGDAMLIV